MSTLAIGWLANPIDGATISTAFSLSLASGPDHHLNESTSLALTLPDFYFFYGDWRFRSFLIWRRLATPILST
jgi:hypothetical protein